MSERKVTRANGKPLRYNAIRYMLSNRVYIGEYSHMGVVIKNSVPPIVSEELFNAVQLELAKNSKAPARHTADDDYLLTTKLFCGRCGAMMVAQAGTSGTKGVVYRYYACVRQKKHECGKKPVSKTKLEDFIVHKTMEFLRDDGVIERLSAKLYELQYTKSTLLPKLQEQLKQKEKEIENIVNAVQKGYATEILLKRLAELEKEQNELNDAIAKEQLKAPIFTQDHFRMALNNFQKIDISTQDGKRKIIDAFINSIYLYDDHMKIVYNANGKEETVSLEELESSILFSSGAPSLLYEKATTDKKHKIPTYLVLFCYYILCFCRWTKSLNLTAAFRRFFQKTGLELTTYRFYSIGYYNFIIIFKREQVFRFSLFCCCLSVVFQR